MQNIILIGMPGSGKSTSGVLLAKKLGMEFVDTDLFLQAQEGMLLQEMIDEWGIEGFLDAESKAIQTLNSRNAVIATGGSAVLRKEAMAHLQYLGKIIYLRLPLEEVAKRVGDLNARGVVLHGGSLADEYARRAPLYEGSADTILDGQPLSIEKTVERLALISGELLGD